MKYQSLNKASVKVTKKVLSWFNILKLNPQSLITVKPIPKIEEFGFIGVQVLCNNYCLGVVTIDMLDADIKESKPALQYLSTRINKLFDENIDKYV